MENKGIIPGRTRWMERDPSNDIRKSNGKHKCDACSQTINKGDMYLCINKSYRVHSDKSICNSATQYGNV